MANLTQMVLAKTQEIKALHKISSLVSIENVHRHSFFARQRLDKSPN